MFFFYYNFVIRFGEWFSRYQHRWVITRWMNRASLIHCPKQNFFWCRIIAFKITNHFNFFEKANIIIFLFTEKDFLEFFFKRLKQNDTGSYEKEFPYYSPCGRERNFVRCDDLPIVFTHIIPGKDNEKDRLSYGGAGNLLTVEFRPDGICMLPQSGRVYHPGVPKAGGVGLVKSSLAIELSKNFEFESLSSEMPKYFNWKGQKYTLTNELIPLLEKLKKLDAE